MNKTIPLFINDLKYVTISLEKDRKQILEQFTPEILNVDAVKVLNRFSTEYDSFFQKMDLKLHNNSREISQKDLMELLKNKEALMNRLVTGLKQAEAVKEKINETAGYDVVASLDDLKLLLEKKIELNPEIKPAAAWFYEDSYQEAKRLLKEIKRRLRQIRETEDIILCDWKEEVFLEQSRKLLEESVRKEESALKYLNTSYWKAKSKFKALSLKEEEAVTADELKQLLGNILLREEHLMWMTHKEKQMIQCFGESLYNKETEIDAIEQQMEAIYRISSILSEESKKVWMKEMLIDEKFINFCEVTQKISQLSVEEMIKEDEETLHEPIKKMIKKVESDMKTMSWLRKDYETFYRCLKKKPENFTLNEMRSHAYVLERLQQKRSWLKTNELKIVSLLDTTELQIDSDWEELKMTAANNSELNFSEYRKASFEECCKEVDDYLELAHMIKYILEVEQPIHKTLLQKRLITFLGIKRINKQMKEAMESFLLTLPDGDYEMDGEFIQSVHFQRIKFRCVKEEEEKRPVEMIAPVEWQAGVLRAVKVGQEVTTAQIESMLLKELLMKRKNKAFSEAVLLALRELKAENKIVRHSAGWRIARA